MRRRELRKIVNMVTDVGNTSFAARMEAVVQTLKPCPFCADRGMKPADVIVDDSGVNDFSVVFCPTCGARGPKSECWESASDSWNRRSCNGCDGRGCPKCNPPVPELRWTTQRPCNRGWYWFEVGEDSPPDMVLMARAIVLVGDDGPNTNLRCIFANGRFTVRHMGGRFAGPISEPQEPTV